MTKIISYGFVSPSSDLLGKLDEARKQNTELLKDLSVCMANYTALKRKYDRIVNNINQKPTRAETGENDGQP